MNPELNREPGTVNLPLLTLYNALMPSARLCVYCARQPAEPRWRPFCSERCKMADLGRWLNGSYRVPVEPAEDTRDEAQAPDETPDR
jgi:endogenous inhibitor of DNA gyrase (YacG/DUF329 family)